VLPVITGMVCMEAVAAIFTVPTGKTRNMIIYLSAFNWIITSSTQAKKCSQIRILQYGDAEIMENRVYIDNYNHFHLEAQLYLPIFSV
jgi:hypothetical protein